MSPEQQQAFKAASGNVEPSLLNALCLGVLYAVLLVWAAWAFIDVWQGWVNGKVRPAMVGRFLLKATVLLVLSLWMFFS